ncbi:MAG: glycosyltransferase family 2 protein [Ilumatobacteraceae bacterium]
MNADTLVVIPAWNEAPTIRRVIEQVRSLGLNLVVVNDGSTDETAKVARLVNVPVLDIVSNQGVGSALRCGFRWAVEKGYTSVLQVDADGQHDVKLAEALFRVASETNADIVIGSRFLGESQTYEVGRARRVVMRLMASSASLRAGYALTDVTSGFRLIRQPLLGHLAENLPNYYLGDTFEAVFVAAKRGYLIREVPVSMKARSSGHSSASRFEAVGMIFKTLAVTTLGLHFDIPDRSTYLKPKAKIEPATYE